MSTEENFESQAREMGWVEKEHFRGDPEKWVDAKVFVERGENFMPMLRANNKRLREDLLTRDKEIDTLKQTITGVQKAMSVMQKHYDASVQQQVAQAKKDLANEIREARESGDTDLEVNLLDRLADLRQTEKEAKAEAKKREDEPAPEEEKKNQAQVEFESWNKDNPWFGGSTPEDRKRTKATIRIMEDLRDEGETSVGLAFMEKVKEELEKLEGGDKETSRRPSSKVESGNSGARGTAGRAFDKLPKEAKDICHQDNDRFVGPGKMYKTTAEWEDAYANSYNEYEG